MKIKFTQRVLCDLINFIEGSPKGLGMCEHVRSILNCGCELKKDELLLKKQSIHNRRHSAIQQILNECAYLMIFFLLLLNMILCILELILIFFPLLLFYPVNG
jgi:hypothetical protein